MKTVLLAAAASLAVLGGLPAFAAEKGGIKIDVYNPGQKGVFPVSSEIVSGPREVILIDAQFSRADAKALVAKIKATGKVLTTIYISHSDPDYYFGLDTIKAAFPNAKVLATPQTVAAIKASKDGKLAFWGPVLKENAPEALIVPEPLDGDSLTVDGKTLKVVGLDGPSPDRTFVWIPSEKAVLGGISVVANEHVWIADTQTAESRENWKSTLSRIEALEPSLVVPGHFVLNTDGSQPFTLESVKFTRDYLNKFEAEAAKAESSAELIASMKKAYPGLSGEASLELSAKVVTGEMKWPAAGPDHGSYPAMGKKVEVKFGDIVFQLDFARDGTMHFIGTEGAFKGVMDAVEYTAVEIRPNVFMVYWREPKVGANVVHIQDFEKGVVYTNIAQPNGQFLHMTGTLRIMTAE